MTQSSKLLKIHKPVFFLCPWDSFPSFLFRPGSALCGMGRRVVGKPRKPTSKTRIGSFITIRTSSSMRMKMMIFLLSGSIRCFVSTRRSIVRNRNLACLNSTDIIHQHLVVLLQVLHVLAWNHGSNLFPHLFWALTPSQFFSPMRGYGIFKCFIFFFSPGSWSSWHDAQWCYSKPELKWLGNNGLNHYWIVLVFWGLESGLGQKIKRREKSRMWCRAREGGEWWNYQLRKDHFLGVEVTCCLSSSYPINNHTCRNFRERKRERLFGQTTAIIE